MKDNSDIKSISEAYVSMLSENMTIGEENSIRRLVSSYEDGKIDRQELEKQLKSKGYVLQNMSKSEIEVSDKDSGDVYNIDR